MYLTWIQPLIFRDTHKLKSLDEELNLSRGGTLCREPAKWHAAPGAVTPQHCLAAGSPSSAVSGEGISVHHLQNSFLSAALTQETVH